MSYQHKLQTNRFELKYIINEQHARAISDYVRAYLPPDEHVQDNTNCSYPIYSLYLDSPTLLLYRQTLQGQKNRFKLRIRFYDDAPTSPAFLEIKRRLTNVIRKERTAVCKDGVLQLLNGTRPDPSHIIQSNGNRGGSDSLDRFCDLTEEIGAIGAAYVYYVREAYVSPDSNNLRVTFDRQIRADKADIQAGLSTPLLGVPTRVNGVVLEIKYVDRFPRWVQNMVYEFDLERSSMAKYVHCVDALGLRPSRWLETKRELLW